MFSNFKPSHINIDDRLIIKSAFGCGPTKSVVVVEQDDEGKHGLPVFFWQGDDGEEGWAYYHQIDRIVTSNQ